MAAAGSMDRLFQEALSARYGRGAEPTTNARTFAPDFPQFSQLARTGASRYYGVLRGDRHGRVYVHNPERISIQEMDEMRFDGQIRAAMMLYKLPIQRSRWTINCADKDVSNFLTEGLKPIWPQLIRDVLLAFDFGWMTGEQCWRTEYDLEVTSTQANLNAKGTKKYPVAVVLDRLMAVDPLTLKLLAYNRSGEFAGFEQFTPQTAQVPWNKAFHFANEMEFQELYGVAKPKAAYPFWVFKQSMYEWANIGYEKNSLPVRKMRYPEGRTETGRDPNTGEPQYSSNDETALEMGENMDNMNVVAFPSSKYDEKTMFMWDAEYMVNPFKGDELLAYIDHLNAQILKAMLIPELALNVGSSGSYDLAQEQIRFMLLGLEAAMDQIAAAITSQILNRWARYMFGPKCPKCSFRFLPLADDVKEGLTNVLLETVGQGQPVPLADGSQMVVDWQAVAEWSGIPVEVLTEEDLAMFRQAQEANAPPQPMGPDGQPLDPSQGGGEGGDMPFGKPPARDGGFGTKGGASNQPGDQQSYGGDDEEGEGKANLSDYVGGWENIDGELYWTSSAA